jgi:hypothetical protein
MTNALRNTLPDVVVKNSTWKLSLCALLLLLLAGACAHAPPPAPPARSVLMLRRCASACAPAEAVQASITVNATDEVWECICRPIVPPPPGA